MTNRESSDDIAVSVCIPTYNPDVGQLSTLLASIGKQTWPKLEVLISDDGSSNLPDVQKVVQSILPEAQLLISDQRGGMVGNWNRVTAACGGDFILLPGQDDVLMPAGVEALVRFAVEQELDVAFGNEEYVDSAGIRISAPRRSVGPEAIFPDREIVFNDGILERLAISYGNIFADPCATLVRGSTFRRVGGFSRDYGHAADLEMWIRLARVGRSGRVPVTVSLRRIHENNATISHVASGIAHRDRVLLLNAHSDELPDSVYNRGVARVWMHALRDALHAKRKLPLGLPAMRGRAYSRGLAVINEVLENLRLKGPEGRTWFS